MQDAKYIEGYLRACQTMKELLIDGHFKELSLHDLLDQIDQMMESAEKETKGHA